MTSRPIDLHEPDLAELATLLASDRISPSCLNFWELDGFIAAILVGPEWISPEEWLPLIWGEAEPEWHSFEEACRIFEAIRVRYEQVEHQLAKNLDSYVPIFRTIQDGTVIATDWAQGFTIGMGSRSWDTLAKSPDGKNLLVPITCQITDDDEEIMAKLGRAEVIEFRNKARPLIPYCLGQIRQFWLKRRKGRAVRQSSRQPVLN